MLSSKIEICHCNESRFAKEQEASRLLGNLGMRTCLSKILLIDAILF